MHCSFCKKEIEDLLINVLMNVEIIRKTSEEGLEPIENTKLIFGENLCPDCFSKFSEAIKRFMQNV